MSGPEGLGGESPAMELGEEMSRKGAKTQRIGIGGETVRMSADLLTYFASLRLCVRPRRPEPDALALVWPSGNF